MAIVVRPMSNGPENRYTLGKACFAKHFFFNSIVIAIVDGCENDEVSQNTCINVKQLSEF